MGFVSGIPSIPRYDRRPYDMFDTLKAPLTRTVAVPPVATDVRKSMFDTLKAVRPSLPWSHMPYGRLCFPQKHLSLHGSAAKPTVSRIIRKPLFLLHNRQIEEHPNHRRSEHRHRLQFEEFTNYRW